MSETIQEGVLHFRVDEKFITQQPRDFLREGELDRAIKFLKCIVNEDKHVAQILFGKGKFKEKERLNGLILYQMIQKKLGISK